MTSISQQPVLPPQAQTSLSQAVAQAHSSVPSGGPSSPQAAVPAQSYANATRKSYSQQSASNSIASPNSVAGPAHYGKTDSMSVNGKTLIAPAIPSLGQPTIVNGNNGLAMSSGHDHSRKPSVTISAAGASGYMPNGASVVGKSGGNNIQFGSMNAGGSPAISHSVPMSNQSSNSLAVSSAMNPRITSPQTSPSPIPQPPASGGKPPSSLQGQSNGLSFGSLGGEDASRQQFRPGTHPSGSLTPNLQASHLRRESSQSGHGDMSNVNIGAGPGRGAYQQPAGRGRNYNQQFPQQMPYSPGPQYRQTPSQPRGVQNMAPQFPNQGRGLAPHSPYPAARSPALPHSQPMHPQPGQLPVSGHQMPPQYGAYPQSHLNPGMYMPPYDPNFGYYPQPFVAPPQFIPASPRPNYNIAQPYPISHYGIPQPQQPQPISRPPSTMSERPPSSIGQPQTPMTPAPGNPIASTGGGNSPAPKAPSTTFQIPSRKSAGIIIKDPKSGEVKDLKELNNKQPASPAPPSRSPAVSSTPTPPPSQTDAPHKHMESKSVKTAEEKKNDMQEEVRRKLEADKLEEQRLKDEAKRLKEEEELKEAKKREEEEQARLLQEKKEAEAKEIEEARLKKEAEEAAEAKAKADEEAAALAKAKAEEEEAARKRQEEEDELDRWEAEEAEKERQEQEREAKYQAAKTAEKEKKDREAKEAAARQDEVLRKAEREAEEAEERRIKALDDGESEASRKERIDLFTSLKKDDPAGQSASSPTTGETPGETPAESGAATPVSDTSSMGPPPRAVSGSKQKPAALKLETSKTVEAPQPSAALQSLRSARFLTSVHDVSYPASIASPNPALNTSAPMGKFRYDKNFLMQFQTVFVEKPSETWTEKVKETVGDTSDTSNRTPSTRTPGGLGQRQTSRPGVPQAFSMGSFIVPGGRTIPPGTTSDQRFQASTQAQQRTTTQSTMRYFPGQPTGFGAGSTPSISRNPSSTALAHPQSPRGNPSHQGRGGRNSKSGKPQRENDKDAKTMPLTAGVELKPIQVSATGWKPPSVGANASGMAGPPPGGDGYLAPDVVQRKVKAALNKMTPNNFDKISAQILDIVSQSKQESDGRTLRQVIQLTFEKATDEAHWAAMYAEFCGRMLENMTPEIKDETLPLDKHGKVTAGGTLFRKYLLNRCQQEFEEGWKTKLPEKSEGDGAEAVMLSDEYYIAAAAKRRGLGLVRFIGELYKLGMLTSRIMHMCVKKLVDYEGMPDEAEVESLTSLLKTIGENLDSEDKMRPTMDAYFDRIDRMIHFEGLPNRLKFMLMDIVDLRKKGWKTANSATKGPTTLEEVRAQAVAAERERDLQRQQDSGSRRGGGGGGRMGLGRGDARNFSGNNQFGMQPPPDYQRNTVGMDDLRRLGRGGSRQASSTGAPSFGPTSMFNARGSNTRRTLGSVARAGEESGASSRTGTPPAQKKEDKEAASANAFSALATLDGSEHNDTTSPPPSITSSPPAVKSSITTERQRSKSPLKDDSKAGGLS